MFVRADGISKPGKPTFPGSSQPRRTLAGCFHAGRQPQVSHGSTVLERLSGGFRFKKRNHAD